MNDNHEVYISWRSEPDFRGTLNILFTCLTTLGICILSALHPNIPQGPRSWYNNIRIRLLWVFIGLLTPELLIILAMSQRLEAGRLRDVANKEYVPIPASPKDSEKALDQQQYGTVTLGPRRHRGTRVHGFYAEMGGFAYDDYSQRDIPRRVVLRSKDVEYLLEHRPEMIPDISEATIADKSKADGLAKALLFAQTTFFCLSSLSRITGGLPLALLEVTTLSHALCSLFVYMLWWNKPLNVQEPTLIPEPDEEAKAKIGAGREGNAFTIEWSGGEYNATLFSTVLIGISLLYGAPHLLVWNMPFPTTVEHLLWRVAASFVTGFGIWFVIVYLVAFGLPWHWVGTKVQWTMCLALVMVYMGASLFLIAESFRQLFHLPAQAFILGHWSYHFPHFS